jgi:hypothetical protein
MGRGPGPTPRLDRIRPDQQPDRWRSQHSRSDWPRLRRRPAHTRGVYKGEARSELSVAVTVSPSDAPPPEQSAPSIVIQTRPVFAPANSRTEQEQQQQQ